MDNLRPTPWAVSAGTGEHEPIFMNPMGLVLERLTTPALHGKTVVTHTVGTGSLREASEFPSEKSDQLKEMLVFQEEVKNLSQAFHTYNNQDLIPFVPTDFLTFNAITVC